MSRCSLCNNLEKKDEHDVRAAFEFTPKQILEKVSIDECISCTILLEGLVYFEDETWSFEDNVRLVYVRCLGDDDESLSLEIYFCDDRPKLVLEFFYKYQGSFMPRSKSLSKPRKWIKQILYDTPSQFGSSSSKTKNQPPGTVGAESHFKAIKSGGLVSGHPMSSAGLQWIDTTLKYCLKSHDCPSNSNILLPRRLLVFEKWKDDTISVRIQENDDVKGRYIALSHCWGTTQTCNTTSQNLSEHKKSIPWDTLPKTFQDSIIYCLQLKVYYLWIDALCILQDDANDWQVESGKMGDVYRNSYITLAATASKNGHVGFFQHNVDGNVPRERTLHSCQSSTASIMVREKIKHWIVPPTVATLETHPLLTRGWTFQERILSPRVIHFCNQEMVWECRSQSICECAGYATKANSMEQFYEFIKAPSPIRSPMVPTFQSMVLARSSQTGRKVLTERWHHIIEQYSALNLTKETDRLPALSGLASRASRVLGTYIAGLWEETVAPDLMWRVDKLDINRGQPTEYIGPSWSWVSVNGPVCYWFDLDLDKMLKELKALQAASNPAGYREVFIQRSMQRSGSVDSDTFTFHPVGHDVNRAWNNPYGSVSSGTLTLRRHIQTARLKYVYTRQGFTNDRNQPIHDRREIDKLKYDLQIGHIELPFFADYIFCEPGPHHVKENESLFVMAIHPDVCLVLKELPPQTSSSLGVLDEVRLADTYRRIGIIRQPMAFLDTYLLDWMPDSQERLVKII